jgi:hypothetical protein
LLFLTEQRRDRRRQRDVLTDDGFDGVVEFYGVSRFEEDAFGAGVIGEISFERQPANRAVRVWQVVMAGIEVFNGGDGLFVGDADAGQDLL